MTQHRLTHDPDDPKFPHKTDAGYNRGCHRECCRRAHITSQKRRDALRRAGTANIDVALVARHCKRLLEVTGVSHNGLARVARVGKVTVSGVVEGTAKTIRIDAAKRLLATTPEKILAVPTLLIPSGPTVRLVQGMAAAGYPIAWQAVQIGLKKDKLDFDGLVTIGMAQKIAALADSVEGIPGHSDQSRRYARKMNWYPLAAYDDNGNLIADALEEDPEEAAAVPVVKVLELSAEMVSIERIVKVTGVQHRDVRKYRENSKLLVNRVQGGYEHRDPERAAEVLEACRAYEWDGWSAVQVLEKLGVTVLDKRPPRGRPKRAA